MGGAAFRCSQGQILEEFNTSDLSSTGWRCTGWVMGSHRTHCWVSFPPRQLEVAALGGSWFHTAGHREHIQQGGKACALIQLAAGSRRGWAEAQLLPGMEAQQRSQKQKAVGFAASPVLQRSCAKIFLCWECPQPPLHTCHLLQAEQVTDIGIHQTSASESDRRILRTVCGRNSKPEKALLPLG